MGVGRKKRVVNAADSSLLILQLNVTAETLSALVPTQISHQHPEHILCMYSLVHRATSGESRPC